MAISLRWIQDPYFFGTLEIGPKELPTSPTAEYGHDCAVLELQIVNQSNAAATVSVYDLQGTPIALVPPSVLQPGGMLSMDSRYGRRMPYGISWSSSGAGVHGYIHFIKVPCP
jgi:hypothetical protein